MAELQKINLGTAPAGRDGDPARTANQKMNDNVDVLSAQSALTTAPMITASRTLTSDHIGRRVSISIAADGGVVKLIAAAKCEPDAIVWLTNTGAKRVALATEDGSGDSLALSGLNPGEGAVLDSDGVSAWRVLLRGRSSGASETIEGDLRVMGAATFDARPTFAGKVPYDNGNLSPVDTKSDQSIGGKKDFSPRPTFAGKVPWDSGNLDPAAFIKPGECGTLRRTPLPIAGYAFADGWPGWWAWDKSTGNSPNGGWGVYTQFGNKPDGKFGDQSFQFSLAFDTDGGVWHTRNVNGAGLGWKRFWTEANTIVDANNFIKRA
ncbi:hypothetical protein [Burkholderia ubonensis]|uniref:hypothetical protein n=1 Tax=Burkholderia ubonensis TaxID=101571 RepID=UPI000B242A4E|nr:hypothetical protein [Burkholderia ubonensis]